MGDSAVQNTVLSIFSARMLFLSITYIPLYSVTIINLMFYIIIDIIVLRSFANGLMSPMVSNILIASTRRYAHPLPISLRIPASISTPGCICSCTKIRPLPDGVLAPFGELVFH